MFKKKELVFNTADILSSPLPLLGKTYGVLGGHKVRLPYWDNHVVYYGVTCSGRTAQMRLVAASLAAHGHKVNFVAVKHGANNDLVFYGLAEGNTDYDSVASLEQIEGQIKKTWDILQERKQSGKPGGSPVSLFCAHATSYTVLGKGEKAETVSVISRIKAMLEDIICDGAGYNIYLHLGISRFNTGGVLYEYLAPRAAGSNISYIFCSYPQAHIRDMLPTLPKHPGKSKYEGVLWHNGKGVAYRAGWLSSVHADTFFFLKKARVELNA